MRARWSLIALILPVLVGLAEAAPAPETPPAKPKEETGPMEIDFTPVPGEIRDGKFKIHIVAETEAGAKFKETYTFQYGFDANDVRNFIRITLRDAGWKFQDVGDTKLIVIGRGEARLKNLELKAEGLTKEETPTVKRVTPKDK